jgi:hypothetical protein
MNRQPLIFIDHGAANALIDRQINPKNKNSRVKFWLNNCAEINNGNAGLCPWIEVWTLLLMGAVNAGILL